MDSRKIEEKIVKGIMIASTTIIILSLLMILWTIISNGIAYLNWDMVSRVPEGGFYIGKEGGILNAIIGSLYITVGSALLGLLISIPVVLYINLYIRKGSLFGGIVRLASDVLFGIPSIVYGAFGFTIMIFLGVKTSLLAGIFTVTLLIIPIMVRAMDEVMRTVPKELTDATYSLGATRWESGKVLLKQCVPGIITAILLSFGRAIGDAACVLFTAGYSDSITTSLNHQAATLPLAIYFQLGSPIEEVQGRAYASALILTIIILIISISAKVISKRLSRNRI